MDAGALQQAVKLRKMAEAGVDGADAIKNLVGEILIANIPLGATASHHCILEAAEFLSVLERAEDFVVNLSDIIHHLLLL